MAQKTVTLSTATLNLRFMQNARRAQPQQSLLEKAHVKDDAEWEVSPEIRKSWGLPPATSNSHSNNNDDDLYERSYVPFLFPSPSESEIPAPGEHNRSSLVKPRGRRTFNKYGQESSKPAAEVQPPVVKIHPDESQKTKIKSISSLAVPASKPSKKFKEPASRVIYDNSGVGIDLRPSSSDPTSASVMSTTSVFMKPAGVDPPLIRSSLDAPPRKGKRRQDKDNTADETTRPKKKKSSLVE